MAFLEHARGIIRQVNRAKESVRDLDDNPSGSVSIAMPASVANVLSVPLFQLLKKNYPAIELNLVEGLTGNIRQAFEMGLYDIILGPNDDEPDNLSIERLIREDLYFISQYSGGDRNTAEIDFLDLSQYPIIISQVQHSMGQTVMKYAQEQHLDLKIISSNTALHPAIKLIEAGIGHGISPWSAIYEKYEQKLICARKIINPCMHRTVSMLSPSNRPRTIATLKVMELIRQTVKLAHSEDKWRGELLFHE